MKVELTGLKDPNAANANVADATGVQVKLWLGDSVTAPIDTGSPHILETTETITGGVLSVPLSVSSLPAVDTVNAKVNGSNSTSASYSFSHPGGLSLVFTRSTSNDITTATFDGVAMTLVDCLRIGTNVQGCLYKIEGTAKTGNIVVQDSGGSNRASFAIPVGQDAIIRDSSLITSTLGGVVSDIVASETTDIVLQFVCWRLSAENVTGYSSGQTQLLSDNSPTRMIVSEKSGNATSTGVSTTLTTTNDPADNNTVSITVSIMPDGVSASVGDKVIGVAKWTVTGDDYFFPIDTTVQAT